MRPSGTISEFGRAAASSHRPAIAPTLDRVDTCGGKESLSAQWWLHPGIVFVILGLLPTMIASSTDSATFFDKYGALKYITPMYAIIALVSLTAAAIGAYVGSRVKMRQSSLAVNCETLRIVIWPSFLATAAGYIAWFVVGLENAGGLPEMGKIIGEMFTLSGTSDFVKFDIFPTVPGITTLTQVGLIYVPVEMIQIRNKGIQKASLIRLLIIGAMVLFRATVLSERLALVEFLVPVAVLTIGYKSADITRKNWFNTFAPIAAVIFVVSLFGITEYFRSWASHYQFVYNGSYGSFMTERLIGYYATSINNGALLAHIEHPLPLYNSIRSFREFPLLGIPINELYQWMIGSPQFDSGMLLNRYGNPEFNNPSLIGALHFDFGVPGVVPAAAMIGLISGMLFRAFERQKIIGIVLFPTWYIGVMESSRLYYWAETRYFPVLIIGISIALMASIVDRKKSPLYSE